MIKVGIVALSCTLETCRTKFAPTVINMFDFEQDDYELEATCFTQGFDFDAGVLGGLSDVHYIRDDTCYNKGYSISKIRDYFTSQILDKYDYILFTDDDFKFRSESSKDLWYNIKFMESHPEVGLINFKMTNKDCSNLEVFYEINPTFVYMRGGILVRSKAFRGWSLGTRDCTYYEEAILATKIYEAGYDVYCSSTHNIHRTERTGLGRSIEEKYKDDFTKLTSGGRQLLVSENLAIPQYKNGVPNYRVPCKLDWRVIESHKNNQEFLKSREFNINYKFSYII